MPARVVLIGPPTAGKTVVGRAVAHRLGATFADVDELIEARLATSVAQIFADRGEAFFRGVEAAAAAECVAVDGAVVALGGGAVTTPCVRQIVAGLPVVWLDVSLDEAVARAGCQAGQRPLLAGEVRDRLSALLTSRRAIYESLAVRRVDTTARTVEAVAGDVLAALAPEQRPGTVRVATAHPYDVAVGHDVLRALPGALGGASRAALISTPALAHVAGKVKAIAEAAGVQVCPVEVPVGEAAKTPEVAASCWRVMARAGCTRSDVVVGVGGGATTDLAGMVAATYMRGVDWVAVPTSVLGMVDAAVGGKTGIDLAEGKNLVGAFWEPRAVLADLGTLATLPGAEVRSGLAEVAKEGFTDDERILRLIADDPSDALDVNGDRLAELVVRAVAVKARVVAGDLRERTSQAGGDVGRERLNYGHTLGHAIEAREHYTWRHGEAVAVGCVFAAEVAHRLLGLPPDAVAHHRAVFGALGLPTSYDRAAWADVRALMGRDKKTRGAHLRMVLLDGAGGVTVVPDPPAAALEDAYAAIAQPS